MPDEDQLAVFDTTSGLIYEVTFSNNETNSALFVGNNSVAFNLNSNTYTINAFGENAILIGTQSANIEDSHLFITNGTVKAMGDVIIAGDDRRGELTVTTGGLLEIGGMAHNVLLVGAYPCSFGPCGHLEIRAGGFVISSTESQIGLMASSEGSVLVTGNGSQWITFDTLYIGYEGSGGLVVANGGDVLSSNATISQKPTGIGSAQVEGEFSRWTIPGLLNMSNTGGVAFLRVLSGGTIDIGTLSMGLNATADVTGGTLIIGGIGPITISSPHSTSIGETTGGGEAYVDSLYLTQGATLLADTVIFEEGGFLGGDGSFPFDVTNSGGINPGNTVGSSGIFTVDANYTQLTTGTLFIELGGLNPGEGYDQLIVTGIAQLSGTLDVSAIINFEPQVGQKYEIISANTVTGTFDQIVSHGGLGFDVTYNSNNVSITITSPVDVKDEDLIPTDYVLYQNYPNPFNPTTKIKYGIPNSGLIILQVYNLLGEVVTTLVNEQQPAGNYEVSFDATSAAGGLSSGIYLYKIQAGEFIETKKMVLLR
ncbi:MAG: T9SS type A sorting domain-containing protein [Bacteroidetes bacterium]|nr:T9SS type A sorting domain-containing protein [Bacteroidota bacterium]